jgi:predicted TIM-barrel fold metal-dependent hydrolase
VWGFWPVGGRDRRRVIDISVHDVPLSRKIPALSGHLPAPPPSGDPPREWLDEAKLPDLIQDMDRAGMSTSLVVLHEETEEFLGLAARHPGRLFGLAYFDSLSPSDGLERVQTLCHDHPDLILGVRTAMSVFGQDIRLRDFVPFYQYCLERDLPVQFSIGGSPGEAPVRPTPFGVLAASYPKLRIVCLDAVGGWHPEFPGLLHRFPNLFVAGEGSPEPGADGEGGSRNFREFPGGSASRRSMLGSNWRGRDPAYLRSVERVGCLPWRQRQDVCWRTAAHVYGLRIPGDRTNRMETITTTR